jgi:hypothetical protein
VAKKYNAMVIIKQTEAIGSTLVEYCTQPVSVEISGKLYRCRKNRVNKALALG